MAARPTPRGPTDWEPQTRAKPWAANLGVLSGGCHHHHHETTISRGNLREPWDGLSPGMRPGRRFSSVIPFEGCGSGRGSFDERKAGAADLSGATSKALFYRVSYSRLTSAPCSFKPLKNTRM